MRANRLKNFKGEEAIFQKDGKILGEIDGSNLKNVSVEMTNVLGFPVVKLTTAEFEALENKDDNIIYILTDENSNENIVPSDLVTLGILPKQVSEYTKSDIGTIVKIPYIDASGKILLNNGCIEFEVVGVNHHKDINDETKPTITLMTKNTIRYAAFDAKEPSNPLYDVVNDAYLRAESGNNRWSVSNIRQWLNSNVATNEWFIKQHEYDEAPTADKILGNLGNENYIYVNDAGFLAGFGNEVKQHFATIENKTALCNVDGGGLETTIDKVFLPSYTEMFGLNNNNVAEGTYLSQKFTDDSLRGKTGKGYMYWLRSAVSYISNAVYYIDDRGWDGMSETAYNANVGIAPIIVLC